MDVSAGLAFLVQSICVDPGGTPLPVLPFTPDCPATRMQTLEDEAFFRRHDQPNRAAARANPRGYQASDSVLWQSDAGPLAVQTFDFGTGGRRFEHFDAGEGDGGQIAAAIGNAFYFIFTEDGGAGRQWFVDPTCYFSSGLLRHEGWLLFGDDIAEGRWTDAMARLNIVYERDACTFTYNRSYTRYRLDTQELSFGVSEGPGARPREVSVEARVIVSEHYGRASIETADHLERFYFAEGFGMIRWERWENLDETHLPDAEARAADFAATGRCEPRPFSERPGAAWRQIDCREWLSYFPVTAPFTVGEYGLQERFSAP
ncbi:hypothetical protein [Lutibaculum baratangense]|uniref:Uncharacterized protein n=1 Tax=Lutibaculum baratangense AMV1 TaxID=631454 RepID=V4RH75_9HYPH|nr:hypothetical protein [Lutibaculum baratangense]ESR22635.1 hypothetical protein N177_3771 [Lutibaculum baratangense AMV1]